MSRNTRQYSDFSLLFTTHPVTGDIVKTTNEEAIKASIRNLIQTRHYERPFHPEIGCQVHAMLFENLTSVTKAVMKQTIIDVIKKFEPRATVLDVLLNNDSDNNNLNVSITFKINNASTPTTLTTAITRVR